MNYDVKMYIFVVKEGFWTVEFNEC